jgi:hypothetical protein
METNQNTKQWDCSNAWKHFVSDPTGEPEGLSEATLCGPRQAPMLTSPLGVRTEEPLSGGAQVRTIR